MFCRNKGLLCVDTRCIILLSATVFQTAVVVRPLGGLTPKLGDFEVLCEF